MTKIEKIMLALVTTFTIFVLVFVATRNNVSVVQGSVMQGGEYHATSTSPLFSKTVPLLIVNGSGTLGSVIITGAGTGAIYLYDATTTNINFRTNNTATSTIIIASFPPSPTAGTYTLDEAFYTGLIYDVTGTAVQSTTTVTFRSNQ